jgi:hypothetical protein
MLQAGPLPLLRAGRRRVPAVGVCQQSQDRHEQMALPLGQRAGLLDLVWAGGFDNLSGRNPDRPQTGLTSPAWNHTTPAPTASGRLTATSRNRDSSGWIRTIDLTIMSRAL